MDKYEKELERQKDLEQKLERVDMLISNRMPFVDDKMILKIYKEYGGKIFRRASAPVDYSEKVIKMCLADKKIDTILEIGTLNGIVSAVLSQYCKKVVTLDIEDLPEKYRIWERLNINNIEFHMIRNEIEKEKLINDLNFDFCYMDGNHENYTMSDFMMVRKCGRVLMHEALREGQQVDLLLKALPKTQVKYFDIEFKKADLAYWNIKYKL